MDQQQATISPTIDGILAHNRAFVERRDFERYTTDKYPDKKLAIVSCMDTRLTALLLAALGLKNGDAKIIKVPCPGLVELIEGGVLEGPQMEAYLQKVFAGFGKEHMDAVVLGCTHFPLVKEEIRKALPAEVKIYDGGAGTARETRRRLVAAGLRREQKEKGRVIFYNSSEDEKMLELSRYLLDKAGEEERKS